jgi:hypothetical protein
VITVLVILSATALAAAIGLLYLLARADAFADDGPGRGGEPYDEDPAGQLRAAVGDLADGHGAQWLDDDPGGAR